MARRARNAFARGLRVEGFDFEIEHEGVRRWTQIQGAGGSEGAGWCCSLNADDARTTPEAAAERLLTNVQARVELTGYVHERLPPSIPDRSFDVADRYGARVLACRPRLWAIDKTPRKENACPPRR